MKNFSIYIFFAAFIANVPVRATTIDFEAQGASAPPAFSNVLNSPLAIGIATFRGGQLLKNEINGTDLSTVYATAGGPPSQSFALNANANQIFSLADSGITGVTIVSATTTFWDFAIDNVTFSTASAVVPEPATFLPAAGVLLGGVLLPRRYRGC